MPLYYDLQKTGGYTSNGTTLTESTHLRLLTIANQETCSIRSITGNARGSTAGGLTLRAKTWSTPSTGGTSVTPGKRGGANVPAANTTALNDASAITPGTTQTTRTAIGVAQTGGMGGWQPVEAADGLNLLANGGANGNADLVSIAVGTSVPFDATMEFSEGG